MRAFLAWLVATVRALFGGGTTMPLFGSAWIVESAKRYRLRLIVRAPRARFSDSGWRQQLIGALTDAGFSNVAIYLDASDLAPDWQGVGASTAKGLDWNAWAEVTWAGATGNIAPTFDLFQVARVDDAPTVPSVPTVPSANTAPTAPVPAKAIAPTKDTMSTATRPEVKFTADHSWGFYEGLDQIQKRRGWPKGAIAMLMVMMSESNILATAHNKNGDASGLIQFMPSTLAGLGWTDTPERFRTLSAEQQLPWVEKYFASRPNMPRDPDAVAMYVATFLPAFLPHAGDPDFILATSPSIIYRANDVFDDLKEGVIRVSGLQRALLRKATGPRWKEAAARLAFVEGGNATWTPSTLAKIVGVGLAIGGLGAAAYYAASAALAKA